MKVRCSMPVTGVLSCMVGVLYGREVCGERRGICETGVEWHENDPLDLWCDSEEQETSVESAVSTQHHECSMKGAIEKVLTCWRNARKTPVEEVLEDGCSWMAGERLNKEDLGKRLSEGVLKSRGLQHDLVQNRQVEECYQLIPLNPCYHTKRDIKMLLMMI